MSCVNIVQVVYVTAVVPYVVLVIMLIWNAQLEGAWIGVKFYLIPDWSKLANAKVRLGHDCCYFCFRPCNSYYTLLLLLLMMLLLLFLLLPAYYYYYYY